MVALGVLAAIAYLMPSLIAGPINLMEGNAWDTGDQFSVAVLVLAFLRNLVPWLLVLLVILKLAIASVSGAINDQSRNDAGRSDR